MSAALPSTQLTLEASGIGGILLAAGASSRMGRNKMLISLDGETLVRRSARRALAAGIDPLVVVVGSDPDLVAEALGDLPCSFIHNPDFRGPTSGSLHLGLRGLPQTAGGVVILLGDMIRVTASMIAGLRKAAEGRPNPLAVSRYGDVIAPPLLFRRELFPEIFASSGNGVGKAIARRHIQKAIILDWPPETLADVDTPADLARLTDSSGR